jgi:ketosteroid isomerase-like protein
MACPSGEPTVTTTKAEAEVRAVLEEWAAATRQGRRGEILKHHSANLVIFDVLPPMKYENAESYRRSWEEWQPDTQGEAFFNL